MQKALPLLSYHMKDQIQQAGLFSNFSFLKKKSHVILDQSFTSYNYILNQNTLILPIKQYHEYNNVKT